VYLALFDIDGTLIRSQGVGGLAMERAGRKVLEEKASQQRAA